MPRLIHADDRSTRIQDRDVGREGIERGLEQSLGPPLLLLVCQHPIRQADDLALRTDNLAGHGAKGFLDLAGREQGRQSTGEQQQGRRPGHLPQGTVNRRPEIGERHRDRRRPVRGARTAEGDENGNALLVRGLDRALDRGVGGGIGKPGGQRGGCGRVGTGPAAHLHRDGLKPAIVQALRPAGRHGLVGEDPAEPLLRQECRDVAAHPPVRIVEPEAQGHDDAFLDQPQHPARDGPSPVPDAVNLLLVVGEVRVPRQRCPERPQGIDELPLEVVQVQPGAIGNGRRLELVVDGLGIAGHDSRGLRQPLQEKVDRGHLLVEAERERLRGMPGLMLDRIPLAPRARDQQGGRHDACGQDDGREDQGDPPPQMGYRTLG